MLNGQIGWGELAEPSQKSQNLEMATPTRENTRRVLDHVRELRSDAEYFAFVTGFLVGLEAIHTRPI